MTKHRSHSAAFKQQIAEEFITGETLHALSQQHNISRQLIRIWVSKFAAGALGDDVRKADLLQAYEAKIAALERMVGRQAPEIDLLKGLLSMPPADRREHLRRHRPRGIPVSRGYALMGLPRSTFYDRPRAALHAGELLTHVGVICDEFECYGYCCVGAALRHQGVVVNNKRLRRLMREHDLQLKRRRRHVVTTDSDHASPISPELTKDVAACRPNQLWVADLTYVAIPGGFVYLAAVLNA